MLFYQIRVRCMETLLELVYALKVRHGEVLMRPIAFTMALLSDAGIQWGFPKAAPRVQGRATHVARIIRQPSGRGPALGGLMVSKLSLGNLVKDLTLELHALRILNVKATTLFVLEPMLVVNVLVGELNLPQVVTVRIEPDIL